MRSRLTIAILLISVGMGYGVYRVKYEVQTLKERADALSREVRQERVALEILRAEWAYLTRPARLERLTERHLSLRPVEPQQVATMAELDQELPGPSESAAARKNGARDRRRARPAAQIERETP